MLSVNTDVAIRSSSTSFQPPPPPPSDGQTQASGAFSTLVDSNTDAAATAATDAPQPASGAASQDNEAPAAAPTGATANAPTSASEKNGRTSTTDSGAAATTRPASQAQGTTTTPVPAGVVVAAVAKAAGGGTVKAPGKSATTNDNDAPKQSESLDSTVTAAATQQPQPTTVPTVVVATAQITAAPLSTVPAQGGAPGAGQTTVATSPVPGAIAAAAAIRVAADIGNTAKTSAPANGKPSPNVGTAVADAKAGNSTAATVRQQIAPTQTTASQAAATTDATSTAQVQSGVSTQPATATAAAQAGASHTAGEPTAANARVEGQNAPQPATTDQHDNPPPATTANQQTLGPMPQKKVATTPSQPQGNSTDTSTRTDAATDPAPAPAADQHLPSVDARLDQTIGVAVGALGGAAPNSQAVATDPTPGTTTSAVGNTPLDTANLTVLTGAAVPLNGLAVVISANARAGNSRFEIRLDPPDLGRIDVRLDVDRSGQVTSRLFVEKSETLDMLRRDAPQLQQALQDAGLKTGDNTLQFSLRDQSSQGRDPNAGASQNAQRLVIAEDDAVAVDATRSYGRQQTTSGGIDIRV